MKLKIDTASYRFKRTGFYEILAGNMKLKSNNGFSVWFNELTIYRR